MCAFPKEAVAVQPAAVELVVVPPVTPMPIGPVVLVSGKFISALDAIEAAELTLDITNPEGYELAGTYKQRLTAAGTLLEKERVKVKKPYKDWVDQIDEAAKKVQARIATIKQCLDKKITAWHAKEQARVAAEAKARDAEIARLKKQLEDERAEADRKAREVAAEAQRKTDEAQRIQDEKDRKAAEEREAARIAGLPPPKQKLSFAIAPSQPEFPPIESMAPVVKTETEKALEAVRLKPLEVAAAPAGTFFRVALRHKVVDVRLLPEAFVIRTANDTEIRSLYCTGWKEGDPMPVCAGVEFNVEKTAVGKPKGDF